MIRSTKGLLILASAGIAASVAMAVVVWSAKAQTTSGCPENLCACLGAAAKYDVVSKDFYGGPDFFHERNSPYGPEVGGFSVDASVCANKARLKTRAYDDAAIRGDLVLLASKGVAFQSSVRGLAGYDGWQLGGDLVTGGGKLKGLASSVFVQGVVDTTGTSSKLPDCTQALSDIAAASMTLRGLTPTQTLPALDVYGGTEVVINAGPGVNVIRVPSIRLRTANATQYESNGIYVQLDPATDAVIINLDGSLDLGKDVYVYGDASKVIINMSGAEGAKVTVGTHSSVEPTILLPTGTITGHFHASLSNVFAKRVVLRGADVTDELTCQ